MFAFFFFCSFSILYPYGVLLSVPYLINPRLFRNVSDRNQGLRQISGYQELPRAYKVLSGWHRPASTRKG